jgi:WD40 repeat protein
MTDHASDNLRSLRQRVERLHPQVGDLRARLLECLDVAFPESAMALARGVGEKMAKQVLGDLSIRDIPPMLDGCLKKLEEPAVMSRGLVPLEIISLWHVVRVLGNKATHDVLKIAVTPADVELALRPLLRVVEWYYAEFEKGPKLDPLYPPGTATPPLPVALPSGPAREYLRALEETIWTRLASRKIRESGDYLVRHFRWEEGTPTALGGHISPFVLLTQGHGFILYGAAGSGKSTTFYMIARLLVEQAWTSPESPPLPVLVEAPELVAALGEQLAGKSPESARAIVRDGLLARLCRPLHSPAGPLDTAARETLLEQTPSRLVLMLEGFDELLSPPGLPVSLKVLVTEQLRRLASDYRLTLAVSSRFSERDALAPLDLPGLALLPLGSKAVEEFVAAHWKDLPVSPETVARVFREKLDSRPLYLHLLCKHYLTYGAEAAEAVSRAVLLSGCAEEQIAENRKQLPWDPKAVAQRRCLRRTADLLRSLNECDETDLQEVARQVIAPDESRVEELVRVLKRSLAEEDGKFRFFHLEFRDYWLADALRLHLAAQPAEIESPLLLVFEVPEVMALVVELLRLKGVTLRQKEEARKTLLRVLSAPSGSVLPAARTQRTEHAAALSLFVRLFPDADLAELNCEKICLQGLAGGGQRFPGLRLSEANLRNADLRGAVLDRADLRKANLDDADLRGASLRGANLRGAILQNALLGRLDPRPEESLPRDGKPTDLTGARLADSNWFNVRIAHDGYFQLWLARALPGERELLLATSRGHLLLFDRHSGASVPVETGHGRDVLGLDFVLEAGGWLATACRDCTVRLFHFDPVRRPLALQGVSLLKVPAPWYFTKVRLGRRWLAATDRAGRVYFVPRALAEQAHARGEGLSTPEPCRRNKGAVVCLEAAAGTEDDPDLFYTAGYDGTVLCYEEPPTTAGRWRATECVRSLGTEGGKGNEQTVRALLVWCRRGGYPERLWLGDESGQLRHADLATGETQVVETVPEKVPIFSVAVHPGGGQVAVGMSNGGVRLYNLQAGESIQAELCGQFELPCGDIIRSLIYLDGGETLLVVTWAGLVHCWSLREGRFTLAHDPQDGHWRPAEDRKHLAFGADNEVEKIRGLSRRYLEYLKRIGC